MSHLPSVPAQSWRGGQDIHIYKVSLILPDTTVSPRDTFGKPVEDVLLTNPCILCETCLMDVREIMRECPDAKVVGTLRDLESWVKSVQGAIHSNSSNSRWWGKCENQNCHEKNEWCGHLIDVVNTIARSPGHVVVGNTKLPWLETKGSRGSFLYRVCVVGAYMGR